MYVDVIEVSGWNALYVWNELIFALGDHLRRDS